MTPYRELRETRRQSGAGDTIGIAVVAAPETDAGHRCRSGLLAKFDPRNARVVERRYFGEMSVEETADALGYQPRHRSGIGRSPKRGCFVIKGRRSSRSR